MNNDDHIFKGRPLSPQGEMTLAAGDGASYLVRFAPKGTRFLVLNFGDEWIKLQHVDVTDEPDPKFDPFWQRMPDQFWIEKI